uniref:receptor protein serine/threonine kinase n=1 Tax=Ciona intestinalis TaxID=7719 RepID=Q4H2Q1_CIOIN|nr:transforming growth factor beta receptor [Ciona intestinalis]BAE06726.1 transforming growth factor beta receptor [Ciona intestinalis]|eukprot:NP_001071968.1 transforming growth factor beta receptor [Ciona intestinalis]
MLDNGLPRMQCRCIGECPDHKYNSTCDLKPNAKCFKKLYINEYGEEELRAGCLGSQDDYLNQCHNKAKTEFEDPTAVACCNNGTMCNDYLDLGLPEYYDEPSDTPVSEANSDVITVIAVTVPVFCFLFGLIIMFYYIRLCRRESLRRRQIENENKKALCPVLYGDRGDLEGHNEMMENWSSLAGTSSGSGMPLLVQRTISRQIEILHEIGKGRYGTVMLGKWREEKVALKIFNSSDEESWFRETEIYQTVLLRHDNILGFIAADISGAGSWTQLFLITEYHKHGSLYYYLQNRAINIAEALKLAYTACCGLAHLHTEIAGTQGKPAIAHRDVKSQNILVKLDGQCCIADMGLAVCFSRLHETIDVGKHDRSRRQGTKRYMSPEVLAQSFHPDSFEAYKASDVYSFALVLWEIINRTEVNGFANDYHLPYHDVVGNDPDFDEMRKIVVLENLRPEIYKQWQAHKIMSTYTTTLQECWSPRPESRLSMLRLRKTLYFLLNGGRGPVEAGSSESDRKPSASSSSSVKEEEHSSC